MTKPTVYRLRDAARELAVSVATLYRRIDDGSIATVRFGGIQLVPLKEIERITSGHRKAG